MLILLFILVSGCNPVELQTLPAESQEEVEDEEAFTVPRNELDAAFMLPESAFRLGLLSHSLGKQLDLNFKEQTEVCPNGGMVEYEVLETDVIQANFHDCDVAELYGVANGIVKSSRLIKDGETTSYVTTVSELSLLPSEVYFGGGGEPLALLGNVNVEVTDVGGAVITTKVSGRSLTVPGELSHKIENFTVERIESRIAALYEYSVNARIVDDELKKQLDVQTIAPISGFFGEYPNAGEVRISEGDERLSVRANQVVDSEYLQLQPAREGVDLGWHNYSGGAVWGYGWNTYSRAQSFYYDNRTSLGFIKTYLDNEFPTKGILRSLYSRPLDAGLEPQGFFFSADGKEEIKAEARVKGAMIEYLPSRPLKAGGKYIFSHNVDTQGYADNYSNYGLYDISVSSRARVAVEASAYLYKANEEFTLTAIASFDDGENSSFTWKDPDNVGIEFENGDKAQTRVVIPEGIADPVAIEVQVVNELGQSVSGGYEIRVIPIGYDYVYASREVAGDIEEILFRSPEEDIFLYGSLRRSDYLSLSVWDEPGADVFLNNLDLQPLQVGEFSNVVISDGVSESGLRLRFTGAFDATCIEGTAEVVLHELEYNQAGELRKLAMDFEESCELPEMTTRGVVRVNSSRSF